MSFYSEIVKYYETIFPLKEGKENFVKDIIRTNNYESMLDVGCATGDLCGSMAEDLLRVKGFDLDEAMVNRAKVDHKNKNITFTPGNMLDIGQLYPGESFDLVTCFGNTLVHVDQAQIPGMFKEVASHLTVDGTFMLQILNYDHVFAAQIKTLPIIDNERIRFDRYYHYDSEVVLDFETILTVKETGQQLKNSIPLYPIHKAQVNEWLVDGGFNNIVYYKNYAGDLYDGKHLPLIVVAKK